MNASDKAELRARMDVIERQAAEIAALRAAQVPAPAPQVFADWFVHNYPPLTIISDPLWHAPRIYRAAIDAGTRR